MATVNLLGAMDHMIIRVQSPEGNFRVKTFPNETSAAFLAKVAKQLNLPNRGWKLCRNRNKTDEVKNSRSKNLSSLGLRHGDMLFLYHFKTASFDEEVKPWPASGTNGIKEDVIDIELSKQDGLIHRSRDPQLCHHGPNSKCIHCVPLEPYDQEYLQKHDPPIKHMSFHAYLKQLTSGTDKGKFATLEDTSCKIKAGCTEHPPWPGGICTKCQPSAITLKRQIYRHVDNILFENPFVVEPFLNYWRKTGNQRMGFLYGRYEQHKDLPLAIRAVVTAIYEPPQESTPDSIQLLEDTNEENVDQLASNLGLQRVGWIFTDLVAEDVRKGTVKHLRDINTHFLTAEECLMSGAFQNLHPSACHFSSTGKFGSKFVTVVCSGNTENHIGFEGFQVSNQCMALVRDDCLVPTMDEPALGYVRESSSEQYVPDVFYKDKDSYGNDVTLLARPMPIEYLLVQVTAAFPKDPQFTFIARSKGDHFPVENREDMFQTQDLNALMKYLQQFSADEFLTAMSDFHLLLFLYTTDMLPLKENMKPLCTAVKNKDRSGAYHWSKSEQWATVEQLMAATHACSPAPHEDVDMRDVSSDNANATWTCKHCTFINKQIRDACEICGLPRA